MSQISFETGLRHYGTESKNEKSINKSRGSIKDSKMMDEVIATNLSKDFVTVFPKQGRMEYLSSRELAPTFLRPMKNSAIEQYQKIGVDLSS